MQAFFLLRIKVLSGSGFKRIKLIFPALLLLLVCACKKEKAPPIPGVISGATNLCPGETNVTYTIAPVDGANYYLWTVPDDSKIISGQGTTSIRIDFGNSSGLICVKSCNDKEVSEPSCKQIIQGGVSNTWCREMDFKPGTRTNAVGFTIGNKGYLGTGVDASNVRYNDFWEFDPVQNSWNQKASLPGTERFDAVGFSVGGKGYIGTGWEGNEYFNDFWEYDPVVNQWIQKDTFAGGKRCYSYCFTIGNKAYLGAGRKWDFSSPSDFWEYDPQTDVWTEKVGVIAGGSVAAFSIGNKGYAGLGQSGAAQKYFWEYDPGSNSWTAKGNFPGAARFSVAAFTINNKGYIGLGYDSENNFKDFWEYDPQTDTWQQIPDFGGESRGYVVSFSIGNSAYVGIGSQGNNGGVNMNDFWVYTK